MGAIRLFLALSVVIWHMPNRSFNLLDAGVAVLFFFMISGFYMALTINERYAAKGEFERQGWRRDFYASRFFRLFPTYLAMLLFMVVWFARTGSPSVFLNHPNVPPVDHLVLTVLNLLIVGQDLFQLVVNSLHYGEHNLIVEFVASHVSAHFFVDQWMLIGQAWSLGSELLFYALAPFVVRSPRRLFACLVASLAVRWGLVFGATGFTSEVWSYNFFPSTLCMFVLGSLAYHLYVKIRHLDLAPRIGTACTIVFVLFAVHSMWQLHGVLLIDRRTGFDAPRMWLAFVLFALSLPFVFARWRQSKIDRWIGELSYPLYIVHGVIIGIVFGKIYAGQSGNEEIAVVASLAVAALAFVLIDRPIDAWRHRRFGHGAEAQPRRKIKLRWVATGGAVTIASYVMVLDAVARPEAPPPILMGTEQNYNLVRYDDRIFAIPQGVPITWGAPGYDADPRLIIAQTPAEAVDNIHKR